MRILMVNKYLYPRAGAETYMIGLARLLRRHGHEVAFFGMAHEHNTDIGPCYTIPFVELGLHASTAHKAAALARLCGDALSGRVRHSLEKAVDAFRPDILHAHNVYNQLSPALFAGLAGRIPIAMTVHDYKPVCPSYNLFTEGHPCTRCLTGAFYQCVRHRCVQGSYSKSALAAASSYYHRWRGTYLNDYDGFIAPSAFLRDMLVAGGLPLGKITVIHNFIEAPEDETAATAENTLLYAGRLCVEKGVDTLLQAYHLLEDDKPSLLIAGTGPLEQALQRQAAALGEDKIQWLGHRSREQVASLMRRCRAVVVPSLWFENCSMTILEAMAHGKPVIASDSGGNGELISDGEEGLLFGAGDALALASCLRRVQAGDGTLQQMGAAGRRRAAALFDPEGHRAAIVALYQRLIEGRGGALSQRPTDFSQGGAADE